MLTLTGRVIGVAIAQQPGTPAPPPAGMPQPPGLPSGPLVDTGYLLVTVEVPSLMLQGTGSPRFTFLAPADQVATWMAGNVLTVTADAVAPTPAPAPAPAPTTAS